MEWIRIFDSKAAMENALVENEPRLLLAGSKRLCLVMRNQNLFVFEEKCPHNGETLTKGKLNYLGEIICPWHGYRFNVITGRECEQRCRDLVTYPVKELEEGIFVGM